MIKNLNIHNECDRVPTFKKITIKSNAGLVLINYNHVILDQEIQNNGGCLKQLVQTEKDSCSPLLGRFICHAPRPKVNTIVHPTSYPTHIPFVPSESTLPFLRYSNFKILPRKSKVKVMAEVKVWSHNVNVTSYWLASLSFHVNEPSHSWDTAFSEFDLENPRSMSYPRAT